DHDRDAQRERHDPRSQVEARAEEERHVRAEGQRVAVREGGEVEDAVDQREPDGAQREDRAEHEAVGDGLQPRAEVHGRWLRLLSMGSCGKTISLRRGRGDDLLVKGPKNATSATSAKDAKEEIIATLALFGPWTSGSKRVLAALLDLHAVEPHVGVEDHHVDVGPRVP